MRRLLGLYGCAAVLSARHADPGPGLVNAQAYRFTEGNFPVRTEDHLVQWEMAKLGMGICIMMEEVGDAGPTVTRVLPEAPPPHTLPTWLLTHRELRSSRRMRIVFDRLAESLFG